MNEKKEKNAVKILKGIAKFPSYDSKVDKFTMRLCVDRETLDIIEDIESELGYSISVGTLKHNDTIYSTINIKSGFDFLVFNTQGETISNTYDDVMVYDGAKVKVKINFKPYQYKERNFIKKGLTGYILGIVVLEQGVKYEPQTTFEEFDLLDDEKF